MTRTRLARASLWHYRRTHMAVVAGVATAVAVLAGSLLVGASVRASLAGLVTARLGRADVVIAAENPFLDTLGDRMLAGMSANVGATVPLFALQGVVSHQATGSRAGTVSVYGVDARFFQFHGVTADAPVGNDVWLSPDLADELGAAESDAVILRVARPTDIPVDSLQGRRDDIGRSMRLRVKGRLDAASMGEFSLSPSQGPVRAIFVDLARLQRDLDQAGRANAVLVSLAPSQASMAADGEAIRPTLDRVLTPEDVGLTVSLAAASTPRSGPTLLVEAAGGLLSDDLVTAATKASGARQESLTPVLSWLANRIIADARSVPYSLVAGVGAAAADDPEMARMIDRPTSDGRPPIVLNEWAARNLQADVGAPIELEFYRWADEGRLATERASFFVAGIVPIRGLAADRRLSPPYPGITDSRTVADWDPPFPIDLSLVRPADEEYWDRYRTTAKAFVSIDVAQRLWGTRYGKVSSLRLPAGEDADGPEQSRSMATAIVRELGSVAAGLTVVNVRAQNLTASVGATDFGAYFSYFSFFLVVSALLLAALFFRLGIEQRLREIGVLRATGYSLRTIRQVFVREGTFVAVVGALVGILLAVAWAALMMYGLRTWWVGAVGTTALTLHVDAFTLAIGAIGGVAASIGCIAWTVRGLSRHSPRELLAGSTARIDVGGRSRGFVWALVSGGSAVVLTVATVVGVVPAAAGFFGAGTLVLVAGLTGLSGWLRRPRAAVLHGAGTVALMRLGWHNVAWRPGRSLTSVGLVAAAAFLLVSVDAFRKDAGDAGGRGGGTGGFALIAESILPLVHDPSDPAGREALGLTFDRSDTALSGVSLIAARLRPGDDASCLNLYQPKQPRVVGVPRAFVYEGRFAFASSTATTDPERANPWLLLEQEQADGLVPAIVDATSLQYVLHAAVGDDLVIDAETDRPIHLRIVGSLADSVLQGEILIADSSFTRLFPDLAGYRVLLAEVSPDRAGDLEAVAATLEERLEPYGVDAQSSVRKIEAYHRVENTYLSTFQALGGLGLVLGTIGLAAVTLRNVFERRRELALLAATGYRVRALSVLVVSETLALVTAGLVIGTAAALLSIAPVILERGGRPPALSMVWLAVVALSGVFAALLATRAVRRLPLVASLRSE